ncbi:MAG TPA: DUF3306 domain-containing protein [Steroidobacteraceae bacterium]|jgi:hypothetical protein|nr:DUF3306 domain-containing protein [Steroidobacteraceae bacterium]
MSEPENFLSRWSRLKRESRVEESGDEKRAVDVPPGPAMSSPPAFDPASLPPIESIVADSDIRAFLAAGVPAELTRAALRSAWAADPAIRDFIGIAESQWDFNDPAAIPGFGPLGAADYARDLVARALASPENPASANADSQCSASADEVLQVAAAPADSSPTEVHSVTPGNAPEASADSPARHPHGGALPK